MSGGRIYQSLRPWTAVAAFFGGFAWDALTLGQTIRSADLWILFGYLALAATLLVLLGRGIVFRGSQYLNAALQFLLGGVFSALFIFYFLSSSDLPGYLLVVVLAALLVGNEFLENAYSDLTLSWTLFTLCSVMLLNFAFAHLFRSISIFWFYLGTLVALLLLLIVRQLSKPGVANPWPAVAVAALAIVLHAANVIPPVPLVKKEMLVAHDVKKGERQYVATIERPGRGVFWRSSSVDFHRRGGERVYCFTSVFVPTGIRTTLRHRWQYRSTSGWREAGTVTFPIEGGRREGYRGYSFKQNVSAGLWRVIAESESGAAVGILYFRVTPAAQLERARRVKF